jgi:transcriptional regulator with XRE-family HTH domain
MKMTFGERMKAMREEHGLSLRKLGNKLKFNEGYLSRVERSLIPPSDRLVRAIAEEFNAPGMFRIASKIVPNDFITVQYGQGKSGYMGDGFITARYGQGKTGELLRHIELIELRERYPEHDPWARYDQNFPDMIDDSDLDNIEGIKFLHEIGITPEDIHLYPPLRKKLIELAALNAQVYPDRQNESERHIYLKGMLDGIRQAFSLLKKTQSEQKDYILLAAFYEPEIASAISDFLETLKKLDDKRAAKGQAPISEKSEQFPVKRE